MQKPFYRINDGKRSTLDDRICGISFGVCVKSGDEVEMMVDFDQLSLCWKVNGKCIGKSHDITKDKSIILFIWVEMRKLSSLWIKM